MKTSHLRKYPKRRVTKKQQLVREVSWLVNMSERRVSPVINEFLNRVKEHLIAGETVQLETFGELELTAYECNARMTGLFKKTVTGVRGSGESIVRRKHRVTFRKAPAFTRELLEKSGSGAERVVDVEKYGVDESGSEQEKKASQGCPKCGAKVEKHGNVLACPNCGTEPFEGGQKK